MHLDPALAVIVGALLSIIAISIVLHRLNQPLVVAYILVGIMMGPYGLKIITDDQLIARFGSIGVVLLLFFIGMEVSPKQLAKNWKVSFIGTLMQILMSVAVVFAIGIFFKWPISRSILIGFVISLSSTAVILKMLTDWKELETTTGQNVLGILLVQDMAIVPMLIVIGVIGGVHPSTHQVILQTVGGIGLLVFMGWIAVKETIKLPLSQWMRNDHEMQVFFALLICFGLALITGLLELSTALGAFVAGMVVGTAKETQWVHRSLNSFRILFVALFFVSIGMLVDLGFVVKHWNKLILLVSSIIILNTLINAVVLKILGSSWRESFYAGTLLSQIGEFSFILVALGYGAKIINEFTYQMVIATIALSLLISPAWIGVFKRICLRPNNANLN